MRRLAAILLLLLLAAGPAFAQAVSCTGPAGGNCVPVSALAPGTPIEVSATGTTAAVAATLPAAAGKLTYLCGFSVSPGSAAAAITLQVAVTGLANTLTWAIGAPVTAAGTTGAPLTQSFSPCLPSSAVNTGIVVTSGALGTSGINNDVNAWGFQL
jgi:hypothetical protein